MPCYILVNKIFHLFVRNPCNEKSIEVHQLFCARNGHPYVLSLLDVITLVIYT